MGLQEISGERASTSIENTQPPLYLAVLAGLFGSVDEAVQEWDPPRDQVGLKQEMERQNGELRRLMREWDNDEAGATEVLEAVDELCPEIEDLQADIMEAAIADGLTPEESDQIIEALIESFQDIGNFDDESAGTPEP